MRSISDMPRASIILSMLICIFAAVMSHAQTTMDEPPEPTLSPTSAWTGTGTLSPVCNGGAYQTFLSNSRSELKLAHTSPDYATTYPFLDCFSYLRVPIISSTQPVASRDLCKAIADRTELDLQFYDAVTRQRVGSTVPLDLIFGDAIHATAYPMNTSVYVEIHTRLPRDLALPTGCSVQLRYSLPRSIYKVTTKWVQELPPRIHDLDPFIAIKGQTQQFRFVRPKNNDLISGSRGDRFYIASRSGCIPGPNQPLDDSAYPVYSQVPVDAPDDVQRAHRGIDPATEVFASWNFTFNSHGFYFLCVMPYGWTSPKSTHKALELGQVSVFGGNPAFYTVEGKIDPKALKPFTKYTFILEGRSLDLRPGKDQAKIVNPRYNGCEGNPAHGIVVATDLGPGDDFGHHVSRVRWEVEFKGTGSFWVCYKRYGSTWGRVYPLRGLSSGTQEFAVNLTHLDQFHENDTFAPAVGTVMPTTMPPSDAPVATTTTAVPLATFTAAPTIPPLTEGPTLPFGTQAPPPTTTVAGQTAPPITTTVAPAPRPTRSYVDEIPCTPQAPDFIFDPDSAPGNWVAIEVDAPTPAELDDPLWGQDLAQAIAKALCVPIELVYISKPYETGVSWEIRVELSCVKECSNDEKLSYLAWLFSSMSDSTAATRSSLRAAGAQSAATQNGRAGAVDVEGEEADEGSNFSLTIILVVIALLVVVIGLVIVVVVLVQNNRRKDLRRRQVAPTARDAGAPIDSYDDPRAEAADVEVVEIEVVPGAAWDETIEPVVKKEKPQEI